MSFIPDFMFSDLEVTQLLIHKFKLKIQKENILYMTILIEFFTTFYFFFLSEIIVKPPMHPI